MARLNRRFSQAVWDLIDRFGDAILRSDDERAYADGMTSEEFSGVLARAVLLMDVALIDRDFDAREYEFILHLLEKDMGISRREAIDMAQTAAERVQLRGSCSFSIELHRRLSLPDRQRVMDQIRHLILADGTVDGFERYLEKKLSDMLGV